MLMLYVCLNHSIAGGFPTRTGHQKSLQVVSQIFCLLFYMTLGSCHSPKEKAPTHKVKPNIAFHLSSQIPYQQHLLESLTRHPNAPLFSLSRFHSRIHTSFDSQIGLSTAKRWAVSERNQMLFFIPHRSHFQLLSQRLDGASHMMTYLMT